jgi:hypothetical protein
MGNSESVTVLTEDYSLVGCDVMYAHRNLPSFWSNLLRLYTECDSKVNVGAQFFFKLFQIYVGLHCISFDKVTTLHSVISLDVAEICLDV